MVDAEIIAYYEHGLERDRLASGGRRIEFLRIWDLLERCLPAAPARVLDVGGGAGAYAIPLAAAGYEVHLIDPVPLHVAQAAEGWDQQLLAAHGVRRNPATGQYEPPSASTLGRLPRLLDADELEAGLSGWAAAVALDPQLAARTAARRASGKTGKKEEKGRRRRRPPAAEALREARADSWTRIACPAHSPRFCPQQSERRG